MIVQRREDQTRIGVFPLHQGIRDGHPSGTARFGTLKGVIKVLRGKRRRETVLENRTYCTSPAVVSKLRRMRII